MTAKSIVWIHGWGMSPDVWKRRAEFGLPEFDHLWLDFAGCSSMRECVDKILELAGHRPGIVLAGWSLGSMLAIEAAISLRERLTGLILMAPTLKFCSTDKEQGWHPRVLDRMLAGLSKDQAAVIKQFRENLLADSDISVSDAEMIRTARVGFSEEGLVDGLRYLRDIDLTETWESLIQSERDWRVMTIHGERDSIVKPIDLPGTSLRDHRQFLPGAGHLPFAERETTVYEGIRSFLNGD